MGTEGIDDTVLMVLSKIMISETSDHQIIVLKEKDGTRNFPIVIGMQEAWTIDRAVKNIPTPRPLTHDLLSNMITSLDVGVERITINDLQNNTFYATIVLNQNGAKYKIDARPSDAIVLATQMKAKIYVSKKVIDEVCKIDAL